MVKQFLHDLSKSSLVSNGKGLRKDQVPENRTVVSNCGFFILSTQKLFRGMCLFIIFHLFLLVGGYTLQYSSGFCHTLT